MRPRSINEHNIVMDINTINTRGHGNQGRVLKNMDTLTPEQAMWFSNMNNGNQTPMLVINNIFK